MPGEEKPQAASSRLCLNMIVRNEAANIVRCLESVAGCIDHWVILDTGSEDETPRLIQSTMARLGVPGELHHGPFEDFSSARNRALQLCRLSPAHFDYLLLIDADMELVVDDPEWRSALGEAAYTIVQSNGIQYDNVRLLRSDLDARYRGVTHEYLDTGCAAARLQGLRMIDHASGGNRPGKLERDLDLLQRGLEEEPGNLRYMFYLAQTLRDAGRHEEALHWYRRRAAAGGWEEERWYAAYQQAACLFVLDRGAEAREAALAAWESRPWRAEPLALLSRRLRERGDYNLACAFAELGMRQPFPAEDRLFLEPDVYRWRFAEDLSIAGFYVRDASTRNLAALCCRRLALDPDSPATVRHTARRNLRFYANDAGDWLNLEVVARFQAPGPETHAAFNPSICIAGERRALLLRQSNYRLVGRRYDIDDPDGIIRTRNYLLPLDAGLEPLQPLLLEPTGDCRLAPRSEFPVRGYEDGRLFRWKDAWWTSATVRDTTADGLCEMALLRLDEEGRIEQETLLRGPWSSLHQKNWMPLVRGEELFFVYSLGPTVVLRYDENSGSVAPWSEAPAPLALEHLRGGSQLLRTGDGWLGVCHEAVATADEPGAYLHRLFRLDESLRLAGLSDAFRFAGQDVEFCAGAALDPAGRRLLVSFGVNDGSALLAAMPLDRVEERIRRLA